MKDFIENDDFQTKVNPKELISLGVELGKQKKFEDALKMFEAYLEIDPWDALVINNKADCYAGMKKLDEARNLELYALTLNPRLAIGWCTLGEIQSLNEESFCARLNIELALELIPKDNEIYTLIAKHIQDLDEGRELTTNIYL